MPTASEILNAIADHIQATSNDDVKKTADKIRAWEVQGFLGWEGSYKKENEAVEYKIKVPSLHLEVEWLEPINPPLLMVDIIHTLADYIENKDFEHSNGKLEAWENDGVIVWEDGIKCVKMVVPDSKLSVTFLAN